MKAYSFTGCFLQVMGYVLLAANPAIAQGVRIASVETWSTVFGGDDLTMSVRVTSAQDADERVSDGTLRWAYSANQRTISRGETELQADGNVSATAEFALKLPELRDGVIFATTITTDFVPRGKDKPAASLERTLWLFPHDPLAGRMEWAETLDIELFDPVGTTVKHFDEIQLPYRLVNNSAALNDASQHGVLIIGEGVSLVRNRTLAESIFQAAAAGRRVLLLAPADGSLVIPGTNGDGPANGFIPGGMRFARQQIIPELDKRLDATAWQGTGNVIPCSSFVLESRRGQVVASASENPAAWPWLEVQFPQTKGSLNVCGFKVMEHWNNGPTPRFLLVRVLESLSEE